MFGFFKPKDSSPNSEDRPYKNERDAFINKVRSADFKEWQNVLQKLVKTGNKDADKYAKYLILNAKESPSPWKISWISARITMDADMLRKRR